MNALFIWNEWCKIGYSSVIPLNVLFGWFVGFPLQLEAEQDDQMSL
jgi:hypothetical protein